MPKTIKPVITIAVAETTNLRQIIVRACTDGLGSDRGVTTGALEEEKRPEIQHHVLQLWQSWPHEVRLQGKPEEGLRTWSKLCFGEYDDWRVGAREHW